MDFHKISSFELFELYGHPVKIIFVKSTRKISPIYGNVYTIDPKHKTIGIVEFQNEQPTNLVLIPSSSIFMIENLSKNQDIMNYMKNNSGNQIKNFSAVNVQKACMIFDKLLNFKSTENLNDDLNKANQRYKNIVNLLQKRQIEFQEIEDENQNSLKKTLLVGGVVRIIWPYTDQCLISTNQNVLRKIKLLIKS